MRRALSRALFRLAAWVAPGKNHPKPQGRARRQPGADAPRGPADLDDFPVGPKPVADWTPSSNSVNMGHIPGEFPPKRRWPEYL